MRAYEEGGEPRGDEARPEPRLQPRGQTFPRPQGRAGGGEGRSGEGRGGGVVGEGRATGCRRSMGW